MADSITNKLGFDVSSAIESLNSLKTALGGINDAMNTFSTNLATFNTNGKAAVETFKDLAKQAQAAAEAIASAQGPTATSASPAAAPVTQATTQQILAGAAAAGSLRQSLAQASNGALVFGQNMQNAGNQTQNALNNSSRAVNNFQVSFATLSRVIATQLIVRAMSTIRNAIEESFQANTEFINKISEISTIAPEASQNIGGLAQRVRDVSDSFNIPLLDTAKGLYQAISNGFVTAADSQEILTTSAKFAKVTLVDEQASVNLLTGTLNAFGLSAADAGNVAGKFIETIRLGRTTGPELANSFSRVAPVAKEIGVTLDELDAAFATVTIGGVKTSEAATELRGVLSAMLKPSQALQQVFHQLGVENGEQLISANGLAGALKLVIDQVGGSSDAVAKLFPNIRALNGVLQLASDEGGKRFEDRLQAIQAAAQGTLNKAFDIKIDTDAEKALSDLNKVKNFFTVDIGSEIVKQTNNFFGLVGGVDTVTSAIKALIVPLEVAIGLATAYAIATGSMALASQAAAKGVTLLTGTLSGLGAVLAAAAIGSFFADRIEQEVEKVFKDFEIQSQAEQDKAKAIADAQVNLESIKNQKIVQDFNQAINELRKGWLADVDSAKTRNADLITETKLTLNNLISAHEQFYADLKRRSDQSNQAIIASQKKTFDLQQTLDDTRFHQQIENMTSLEQAQLLLARSQAQAATNADRLSHANTPTQIEQANSGLDDAQKLAQEALAAAQRTGSADEVRAAEFNVLKVLQQQIEAQKELQSRQSAQKALIDQAAAAEQQRINDLKTEAKELEKNLNLFDKNGNPLPDSERSAQVAKAQQELQKFFQLAFSDPTSKFNVADFLSFAGLQQRLNQAVTQSQVNLIASNAGLNSLNKQIQGNFDNLPFFIKIQIKPGGTVGEALDKVSADAAKTAQNQQDVAKAANLVADAESKIAENAKEAAAAIEISPLKGVVGTLFGGFANLGNILEGLNKVGVLNGLGDGLDEFNAKLATTKQNIADLLNDKNITPDKFNAIVKAVNDLLANQPGPGHAFDQQILPLARALPFLQNILNLQQKIKDTTDVTPVDTKSLEAARQAVQNLGTETQKVKDDLNNSKTDSGTFKTSLDGSASSSATLAANLADAAASMAELAFAASNVQPLDASSFGDAALVSMGGLIRGFAHGGLVNYFAKGGFARGTDTVPAMLSPGEFVVKADSTRKFFSQLQAINAGVTPTFRSEGGPVSTTNITIGDIAVHSNGKQTSRDIANGLRRELRRETSRL